jgi:hypothetical protein
MESLLADIRKRHDSSKESKYSAGFISGSWADEEEENDPALSKPARPLVSHCLSTSAIVLQTLTN